MKAPYFTFISEDSLPKLVILGLSLGRFLEFFVAFLKRLLRGRVPREISPQPKTRECQRWQYHSERHPQMLVLNELVEPFEKSSYIHWQSPSLQIPLSSTGFFAQW